MIFFGWDPGTLGEFAELSRMAQENRRMVQELADDSASGLLGRAVAAGTLKLRDLAAGASPVDTGTLQSAHRAKVEGGGAGVLGMVFIDPYARNPVYGGQPAVYGEVWAVMRVNWFERIGDAYGESVLDGIEQALLDRAEDLWL